MDRKLLHFYNVELQHIRQMAGEFAREYPKIAGRLSIDKDGKELCPDPFVERLLEGFAYLTARVQVKLDAEFPRFSHSLLETVYPEYLHPIPSMAVVRFEADMEDQSLASGFDIPRGTPLRSQTGRNDPTACTFRTAHAVKIWPIRLGQAGYMLRNLVSLNLPATERSPAAIRMLFHATAGLDFSKISLDRLTFFLRGTDELPSTVLEHILSHGAGVWVRSPDAKSNEWHGLGRQCIRPVGFEDEEALLPPSPTTFAGYRLLTEYFAFSQRFLFFEINGLQNLMKSFDGKTLEVVITLNKAEPSLEGRINGTVFDLFCTPVINLFEKRTDRINLTDRSPEFHVVADRTRPLDYEIFSIRSVRGYGMHSGEEQPFLPFYMARDTDQASTAFYTVNRVPRAPTEREKKFGRLSSYAGSEVFLSLVDTAAAPYSSDLEQLGVTALCTNRHLPIRINRGDGSATFAVELNGPVRAARCLAGPTVPLPSFAVGETSWRLVSHLSLNYLSIVDSQDGQGASALRDLLELYVSPNDLQLRKQIEGVLSIQSAPILRRIPAAGVITFARGLEIVILFDEEAFAGTGVFVLGMVLDHFLARHVAINSFTETVIRTKQRGEIIRWPARTGRKRIL